MSTVPQPVEPSQAPPLNLNAVRRARAFLDKPTTFTFRVVDAVYGRMVVTDLLAAYDNLAARNAALAAEVSDREAALTNALLKVRRIVLASDTSTPLGQISDHVGIRLVIDRVIPEEGQQ